MYLFHQVYEARNKIIKRTISVNILWSELHILEIIFAVILEKLLKLYLKILFSSYYLIIPIVTFLPPLQWHSCSFYNPRCILFYSHFKGKGRVCKPILPCNFDMKHFIFYIS